MIAAQTDLFEQPRHAANADVEWFEKLLRGGQCWMTATDILISIGRPVTDANKRWLRELASQSEFILAGQRGYLHLESATAEEINHCCNWLNAQALKMSERAGRLRKNAHRIFG